jgi:hypothetical protein
MSITLAEAVIQITAQSDLSRTFSQARQQTETFTTGLAQSTQSAMGGILNGAASMLIGGLVTRGLDALGGAVKNLFGEMISGNSAFEQYQTQFEVMLGSAEGAQQRIDELAEFGATTPFELPGIIEADRILQGFGLHSQESAAEFGFSGAEIRRIAGDVSSGVGAEFKDMALTLGKFSAGATGEALARFAELGITSRKELTAMGLEFDKAGSLTSPLPEAMNTVLKLMDEKYGGMMDAQSKTFAGMMSNFEDWKSGMIRKLGEPIFDVLKEQLGTVLTLLNSPEMLSMGDQLGITMARGVELIMGVINSLIMVLGVLKESGLNGLFSALSNGVTPIMALAESLGLVGTSAQIFVGIVQSIVAPMVAIVSNFVSWKDILAALAVVIGSVVIPAIAGAVSSIAMVATPIIALIGVIALLRTAWEQNWGGIQERVAAFVAFVGPLLVDLFTTWQQKIGDFIAVVWPLLVNLFTTWQQKIGDFIAVVWPLLVNLFTTWQQKIGDFIAVVWPLLVNLFTTWQQKIGDFIAVVWPLLVNLFVTWQQKIGDFIAVVWPLLVNLFVTWQQKIGDFIAVVWPLLVNLFVTWQQKIGDFIAVVWPLLVNLFTTWQELVSVFVSIVGPLITSLFSSWQSSGESWGAWAIPFLTTLWNVITEILSLAWDVMTGIITVALEMITSLISAFTNLLTGNWQGFVDDLKQVWVTLWDAIVAVVDTIWNKISPILADLWSNISRYWKGIDWASLGKAMIEGIASGLSGAVGWLVDQAIAAAMAALNAAKAALGLGGGSSSGSSGSNPKKPATKSNGFGSQGFDEPTIRSTAIQGVQQAGGRAIAAPVVNNVTNSSPTMISRDEIVVNVNNNNDLNSIERLIERRKREQIEEWMGRVAIG